MSNDKELKKLFEDPLLQNIEKEDLSLFEVPENLKKSTKDSPDYVAQRVPCANFSDYEPGFRQVQQELKSGKRSIQQLKTSQSFKSGSYYITSGVMLYLEHIDELVEKKKRKKKTQGPVVYLKTARSLICT